MEAEGAQAAHNPGPKPHLRQQPPQQCVLGSLRVQPVPHALPLVTGAILRGAIQNGSRRLASRKKGERQGPCGCSFGTSIQTVSGPMMSQRARRTLTRLNRPVAHPCRGGRNHKHAPHNAVERKRDWLGQQNTKDRDAMLDCRNNNCRARGLLLPRLCWTVETIRACIFDVLMSMKGMKVFLSSQAVATEMGRARHRTWGDCRFLCWGKCQQDCSSSLGR